LSLFYCNTGYLYKYLEIFANKITVNNSYVHKHNNEMQFLDIFNETDIDGYIQEMYINDYSFNTIDELEKIKYKLI